MNRLSPRELQVAQLIAQDRSDKAVASALGISVRTVQQYLDRIARKIGASRGDLSRRRAIRAWIAAEQSAA